MSWLQSPENSAYGLLQSLEIDGLDQMLAEASLPAALNILLHSKTAQGNPGHRLLFADTLHQLESCSVGKPDVADQQIVLPRSRQLESTGKVAGRLDLVTATLQQQLH